MGNLKYIRRKKMIEQNGRCYYCDLPMLEGAAAPYELRCTAEHLHPRSEGGEDTEENIVAACWFCNTHRHRRRKQLSPKEFRRHVQKRMATGKWLSGMVLIKSAGVERMSSP